jgi:hypothetical protein
MALQPFVGPWPLFQFVTFFTQTIELLGWGISPAQGRFLQTGQHKHRINAHKGNNVLNGIRTHDPSVQASEDGSCLRPRGHRDRQSCIIAVIINDLNMFKDFIPFSLGKNIINKMKFVKNRLKINSGNVILCIFCIYACRLCRIIIVCACEAWSFTLKKNVQVKIMYLEKFK